MPKPFFRCPRHFYFIAAVMFLVLAGCGNQISTTPPANDIAEQTSGKSLPWMDNTLTPAQRAGLLVEAMSLAQKQQQLVGNAPEIVPELPHCYGARHVRGIAALQIPTLRITNGPVGIGQNDCVDASLAEQPDNRMAAYTDPSSAKATALPSAIAVAASFDPNMGSAFGEVIANEANALALHVFEAPGMNLARIPVLGRNFEYKGEDPYLSGVIAVAEIRAVQKQGVIAMAKHFVANEQETNRMNLAQTVDEQVLRELYLLPFEMSVKDGEVASLMCSYNDVNGKQSCENAYLLTDVLRENWGFEGYVQSDFFAVKSTAESMRAGLDHLMPVPTQWSPQQINAALEAGELQEADLDQALIRRYRQMFRMGIFDRPLKQTPIDFTAGGESARKIGVESGVLLQNNGALPFAADVKKVVVIGKQSQVYAQQAVAGGVMVGKPMGAGGGSSDVVPNYTISPVEGIRNVLTDLGNNDAQVSLVLVADDNSNIDKAVSAAREADAVIIMAGTIAEEGADRITVADPTAVGPAVTIGDGLDWYTPAPNTLTSITGGVFGRENNPEKNSQSVAMIEKLMAADPAMAAKTALVLKDNAGLAVPDSQWILGDKGPAILEVWFPGQEDGHIVADLLFGVHNPSGKLPVTFPLEGKGFLDFIADDPGYFPGVMVDGKATVEYKEGLNIGYRWYDANISGDCTVATTGHNACVAFPFGYGLSYTSFSVGEADLVERDGRYEITTTVSNTGDRAGAEVVQVYLGVPADGQPPKRLVGLQKVALAAGQSSQVTITIDPEATHHPLSVFDKKAKQFVIPSGEFTFYVGHSSALADLQTLTFKR